MSCCDCLMFHQDLSHQALPTVMVWLNPFLDRAEGPWLRPSLESQEERQCTNGTCTERNRKCFSALPTLTNILSFVWLSSAF